MKKLLILLLLVLGFGISISAVLGYQPITYLKNVIGNKTSETKIAQTENNAPGKVLAATDEQNAFETDVRFEVNIPAVFNDTVTFSGTSEFETLSATAIQADTLVVASELTAPNILYSLTADDDSGVEITGDQTLTITNTDKGSAQNIFKNFKLGSTTISAGSNTDTFEFVEGTNIDLSFDTSNKKLTITNSYTEPAQPWTQTGTNVHLTTSTDYVGIGTSAPAYNLEVTGTSFFSGNSTFGGNVNLGNDTADTVTITGGLSAGSSIKPIVDLGSDLGSSSLRFNNLYVGTINTNSTLSTAGQALFTYEPTSTAYTQASVLINPTSPSANTQLLGLGQGGYQRMLVDAEGDLTIGYNDAISAPTSDYPLNIYGHNGTRVSYIDESGNANFSGSLTVGGLAGGFTQGSVIFQGASNLSQDNSNFFWNDTTDQLGIGTSSPVGKLHLTGAITGKALAMFNETGNQNILVASGSGVTRLSVANNGATDVFLANGSGEDFAVHYHTGSGSPPNGYGKVLSASHDSLVLDHFTSTGTYTLRTSSNTSLFSIRTNASTIPISLQSNGGKVGLGTTTPISLFHTEGKVTGKANTIINETGDQDLFTASKSGTTKVRITNSGEIIAPEINKVVVVDGNTYAQTCAGINAAIDALGSAGGEIYLPEGTYTCAETITIDANETTIRGAGKGTIISVSAAASWSGGVASHIINLNGMDYLTLSDFQVDAANLTGQTSDIINGSGVTNSTFENLYLANSDDDGIHLTTATYNVIKNVTSTGNDANGILLQTNSSYNTISASTTTSNGTHGILINSGVNLNNRVTNNLSADNTSNGISLNDCNYCVISNNTTRNHSGTNDVGILIDLNGTVTNNTITGNTCFNDGNGIYIGANYNLVSGNIFYTPVGAGINVASSYNNITGNVLTDDGTANPGISLQSSADDNTVANNSITGFIVGITISASAERNSVTNNILKNNTTNISGAGTNTQFTQVKDGLLHIGSTSLTNPVNVLSVSGTSQLSNALMMLNETGSNDLFTASASGTTRFTIGNDGSITHAPTTTTGNAFSLAATTLTTGNLLDLTATYVDATGGIDSAIDINLTNNSATNPNTLRGLDLSITDSDNLGNTLYGSYITVDQSGNTSTSVTHSIYGGYYSVIGKTTGVTTATGLQVSASGADTNIGLHVNATNTAAIFETGNVVIGDTTANKLLTISHATSPDLLLKRLDSATTTDELLGEIMFDSSDTVSTVDASALIQGYASQTHNPSGKGGYLTFLTKANGTLPDGSATEHMRLTSEGLLGIGTTAPLAKLSLNGDLRANSATISGTYTGNVGLTIDALTNADSSIVLKEAGTTKWTVFNNGDNTDSFDITDAEGDQGVTLAQGATSWAAASDITLKEKINLVEGSLDKVKALRGVYYNFIGNSRTEVGLIAQEVQAVLPELVVTNKNGKLAVMYDRLAPVLVNAINDQQVQIDKLGNVTGIEDRLAAAETKLAEQTSLLKNVELKIKNLWSEAVTFLADVTFKGQLFFNPNQTGTTTIPAGSTAAKITFKRTLPQLPIVNATPQEALSGQVTIKDVTTESFTIELTQTQDHQMTINWLATLKDTENVETPTVEILGTSSENSPQPSPSPSLTHSPTVEPSPDLEPSPTASSSAQ